MLDSSSYKLGKIVSGNDFYGERRLIKARSFLDSSSGYNMLVLGLGMTGKTSFLEQIAYMANNEDDYKDRFVTIYLDLEKVTDEENPNLPIIHQQIINNQAVKSLFKSKGISTGLSDAEQVINKVISVAKEKNKIVVLLCDEIGKLMGVGKVGNKKIGQILTKQLTIRDKQYFRVVAVSSPYVRTTLEDKDETPQWFRDFVNRLATTPETTYYIDPLSRDDVFDLCCLKQRPGSIHVDKNIGKVVVAKGGGHPHFVKIICTKVLGGEDIVNVEKFIGDSVRDNLDFARDIRCLFAGDKEILGLLSLGRKTVGALAKKAKKQVQLVEDRLDHLRALGLVVYDDNEYMIACPFYSTWIQNLLDVQVEQKDTTIPWRWGIFVSLCVNAGLLALLTYIFLRKVVADWLLLLGCGLLFITVSGFGLLAVIPSLAKTEKSKKNLRGWVIGLSIGIGVCAVISFFMNLLFFYAQTR